MQTLTTIAPIFIIIGLGWGAARTGFLPDEVLGPLNRLIYYFAIPAFLFHAISNFPIAQGFNGHVMLATLGSVILFYVCGWILSKLIRVPANQAGAMIQSACHSNAGYVGLPVAFYFLGNTGLAQAGIISGFLMIVQNVMSSTILQSFSKQKSASGHFSIIVQYLKNPVIIGSLLGITVSALQIPVPKMIDRTLNMLGALAPAAALLLIGASLSFKAMKAHKILIFAIVTTKLVLLPACALTAFKLLNINVTDYLPALILLATPTATVAYVMSKQMGSDSEIAVAAISASTLMSAITLPVWLTFFTVG